MQVEKDLIYKFMNNIYENRRYLIFNINELSLIDFNEVLETSAETIRKNIDQTKAIIKWDGDAPNFINNLVTKEGPYTYDEIIVILNNSEWTQNLNY